jgi:hypothetical protein
MLLWHILMDRRNGTGVGLLMVRTNSAPQTPPTTSSTLYFEGTEQVVQQTSSQDDGYQNIETKSPLLDLYLETGLLLS